MSRWIGMDLPLSMLCVGGTWKDALSEAKAGYLSHLHVYALSIRWSDVRIVGRDSYMGPTEVGYGASRHL